MILWNPRNLLEEKGRTKKEGNVKSISSASAAHGNKNSYLLWDVFFIKTPLLPLKEDSLSLFSFSLFLHFWIVMEYLFFLDKLYFIGRKKIFIFSSGPKSYNSQYGLKSKNGLSIKAQKGNTGCTCFLCLIGLLIYWTDGFLFLFFLI